MQRYFRDFHIFDSLLMISSDRIPSIAILWIFIQQVRHLERGRKYTKKAIKSDIERRACNEKSDVPHTNSSMQFFFCNWIFFPSWFLNITASIKKRTSKKVPTSKTEITIKYLHKNIIIPPLGQSGLFMQNVCLKI